MCVLKVSWPVAVPQDYCDAGDVLGFYSPSENRFFHHSDAKHLPHDTINVRAGDLPSVGAPTKLVNTPAPFLQILNTQKLIKKTGKRVSGSAFAQDVMLPQVHEAYMSAYVQAQKDAFGPYEVEGWSQDTLDNPETSEEREANVEVNERMQEFNDQTQKMCDSAIRKGVVSSCLQVIRQMFLDRFLKNLGSAFANTNLFQQEIVSVFNATKTEPSKKGIWSTVGSAAKSAFSLAKWTVRAGSWVLKKIGNFVSWCVKFLSKRSPQTLMAGTVVFSFFQHVVCQIIGANFRGCGALAKTIKEMRDFAISKKTVSSKTVGSVVGAVAGTAVGAGPTVGAAALSVIPEYNMPVGSFGLNLTYFMSSVTQKLTGHDTIKDEALKRKLGWLAKGTIQSASYLTGFTHQFEKGSFLDALRNSQCHSQRIFNTYTTSQITAANLSSIVDSAASSGCSKEEVAAFNSRWKEEIMMVKAQALTSEELGVSADLTDNSWDSVDNMLDCDQPVLNISPSANKRVCEETLLQNNIKTELEARQWSRAGQSNPDETLAHCIDVVYPTKKGTLPTIHTMNIRIKGIFLQMIDPMMERCKEAINWAFGMLQSLFAIIPIAGASIVHVFEMASSMVSRVAFLASDDTIKDLLMMDKLSSKLSATNMMAYGKSFSMLFSIFNNFLDWVKDCLGPMLIMLSKNKLDVEQRMKDMGILQQTVTSQPFNLLAFEPFNNRDVNKALEAAQKSGYHYQGVAVSHEGVRQAVERIKTSKKPTVWMGEFDGKSLTIENTARNDFEGNPIDKHGPRVINNPTLRVIPKLAQSKNAGNYYCNMALYQMLKNNVKGVFIHVPRKNADTQTLQSLLTTFSE